MADNIKRATIKQGSGLRGTDKQQAGLRDDRRGTYDTGGPTEALSTYDADRVAQQNADPGVEAREPAREPAKDFDLPEGLKRQRQGPYDRDHGRAPPDRKQRRG